MNDTNMVDRWHTPTHSAPDPRHSPPYSVEPLFWRGTRLALLHVDVDKYTSEDPRSAGQQDGVVRGMVSEELRRVRTAVMNAVPKVEAYNKKTSSS